MQHLDDSDVETEKILKEYLVPFPSDNEIEKTVTLAEKYIKPRKVINTEKRKRLLYNTILGFKLFPKTFYALSIAIYFAAYVLTANSQYLFGMFTFLAPLPLILSCINIFKGKNENVWEVESVCRVLPQELCVAKLLIVSVFNTVCNFIISIILYETNPGLIFWKVTMLWLVPMVLTGAITLFICSHVKSVYAVPTTLSAWTVATAAVSYFLSAQEIFKRMTLIRCLILIIVGTVILIFAVRKLTKVYSFERGANYGIDNRRPFKAI